jgi:hypothetical protein
VPRRIVFVEEVPVLGTGKTNYGFVEKLAKSDPQTQGNSAS